MERIIDPIFRSRGDCAIPILFMDFSLFCSRDGVALVASEQQHDSLSAESYAAKTRSRGGGAHQGGEGDAKKANAERQADLKRDTDKLLKLATELEARWTRRTENTLSVDVMKKAEEIEKLAHSVKEKMKGY